MSILESLELALKNIVSSKVRTLLTMLGIIIGVAAVIVIVGLGNGLEGYVTESFSDMGTNTLTVTVIQTVHSRPPRIHTDAIRLQMMTATIAAKDYARPRPPLPARHGAAMT